MTKTNWVEVSEHPKPHYLPVVFYPVSMEHMQKMIAYHIDRGYTKTEIRIVGKWRGE